MPSALSRRVTRSTSGTSWMLSLGLTILTAYVYVFSEWLFFVTKPSTLSALSLAAKVSVLLVSPLFIGAAALVAWAIAGILDLTIRRLASAGWRLGCTWLVPTVILTATGILLIENFTRTVFGFSVSSTSGIARFGYAVVFLALFVWIYRQWVWMTQSSGMRLNGRHVLVIASLLVAGSIALAIVGASSNAEGPVALSSSESKHRSGLPNVIVLVGDGVEAASMSAYGYDRKTTPFIDGLISESLVFENHFTNSARTTGAVGALLSGKLPTHTRVIYRPDVFQGDDVYEHLPGVLRGLGYHNGDISVRHFADAYDLNLRAGFHYANRRSVTEDDRWFALPMSWRVAHPAEALFLEESGERISTRLLHALGIEDMSNPWAEVTQLDGPTELGTDHDRLEQLLRFVDESPEPFFAHAHMLGTHGPLFDPQRSAWSKNEEQAQSWMRNFYDDAISDFDRDVERVVEALARSGKLDRTILVINSDHGMAWRTASRLPLIVRFPGGAQRGRISRNSQRIDIAPTILDAIGVPVPDWMEGRSLLSNQLDPLVPIVSTHNQASEVIEGWMQIASPSAPFYTLGGVSVVVCQGHYRLLVQGRERGRLVSEPIGGHTEPCPRGDLPANAEMRDFILEHLEDAGYDVSTLRRRR
jgi:arylsulfatase A-like enzyme